MKRLLAILASALLLGGCRDTDRVTVEPETANDDVVMTSLMSVPDDTTVIPVDSTAILPAEQARFAGIILVNNVKHDAGGEIRSGSFSWVYLGDRARPFTIAGRVFGYYGVNLTSWQNPLTVNTRPMLRIPHRVRANGAGYNWGFEYIRDVTDEYLPRNVFRWQASPDSVGLLDISITTPDTLQILFPRGGTRIPRNRDAVLRWMGQGDVAVVISVVNPLTKRSRPLLHLRPRTNKGALLLNARLLGSLATQGRYFAFTFVLTNRKESAVVARFTGEILVQAAAVYNSYVELY